MNWMIKVYFQAKVIFHLIQAGFGAHLATYPRGTGSYIPSIKATRAKKLTTNFPLPLKAKVKNAWNFTFTSPYNFMEWNFRTVTNVYI